MNALLTLNYAEKKVGLANLVLSAAVSVLAILLQCHYYPLCYQRGTHPDTNIKHRHKTFNQLKSQTDEHAVTCAKGTQQLLGAPVGPNIPEQSPFIVVRMPLLHIQCRLLHSLSGVSVCDRGQGRPVGPLNAHNGGCSAEAWRCSCLRFGCPVSLF